ncbi:MAG TPA: SUMF1/EgtB/PvdO family nonheme iron enzyme [Planctomycetaceae bacterium]|nr:SUMF1/EgtB/PvdO family nonheme iron enzyme [Planctomycetaceae bacterium]
MKIIYEDTVDWEPLHMRFCLRGTPTAELRESLASFVLEWIRQREREDPEKWRFCEYSTNIRPSGTVEAFCELMPQDEVQILADAVADRFPFVAELRLGERQTGPASLGKIDWVRIPADRVVIDGVAYDVADFTIGFTPVTLGQFCEFLDATGHTPIPDAIEYPGYTIEYFKLNYGQSPRIPLFGLTFDDAIAFCDWAGFRLPTDPELRLFYETTTIKSPRKFTWDGENWTSTATGPETFYVRQGPFRERPPADKDPFRKPLHRHHYQQLEAPAFRVVQR